MNVHPYAELMHEYHTAGDDDACDGSGASDGGDDGRMQDRSGDDAFQSIGSIDKLYCDVITDKFVGVDTSASISNMQSPLRPSTTLVIDVSDNNYHPINHLPSSTINHLPSSTINHLPSSTISGSFSWLQSIFTTTTNALFNYSFPSHSHDSSSLDDEHSTVGR